MVFIGTFEIVKNIKYYRWKADFDNYGWFGKITIPSPNPVLMWEYRPHGEIDHINRVRNDNRLCNLRDATKEINTQNASVRVDSPYGIRGVTKHKYSNKYRARIQANKKAILLGLFDTPEEAASAYAAAAAKLHAEALMIGAQ